MTQFDFERIAQEARDRKRSREEERVKKARARVAYRRFAETLAHEAEAIQRCSAYRPWQINPLTPSRRLLVDRMVQEATWLLMPYRILQQEQRGWRR